MVIIARFSFDVPFGKKSALMQVIKKWLPFDEDAGFPKPQIQEGSIGVPESRMEFNYRFESLAVLEDAWANLDDPRMPELQKEMAPLVVPGSHRWEVFRVRDI